MARSAVAAAPAAQSHLVLTGDHVGPIPAATTRAQLATFARVVRDTVEEGDEAIPESVAVLAVGRDTVRAVIDSGRVYYLFVDSPHIRTHDSLGVGTQLVRLTREPGVTGFVYECCTFVHVPRYCGLTFLIPADSAPVDGGAVDAAALKRMPPETRVLQVRISVCTHGPTAPPASQ